MSSQASLGNIDKKCLDPDDDFYLELRERHITIEHLCGSPEPPFLYTQLKSDVKSRYIRLLEVLPDQLKSHRIICRIHQHAISVPPKYEALSYTWGTGPKDRWIVVKTNGNYFQRLDITESLYIALWRLRHAFNPRLLWVDAICINQDDMAERNSQVQMMREIYSRSVGVVIWLGEKSQHSEEALRLIQTINEVKESDARNGIARNFHKPGDDSLPNAYRMIWHDFFDLLKRPWFKRAWIVQELATAPKATIVCGTRQLPWADFHSAVLYMFEIAGTGLQPLALAFREIQLLTNLDQIRSNFQNGKQFTAMEILLYNGHALATDKRDHVFAFHGLLPPCSQDSFITKPKYKMKLPSDGVQCPEFIQECIGLYTERAKMLLENHQNLDLLSVTSVTRRSAINGLPTWVPDWSTPAESECFLWRNILSDFRTEQRPKYRASGSSSYTPCQNSRKLLLKGHTIDMVSMVSEVNTPLPNTRNGLGLLSGLEQMRHSIQQQRTLQTCELVGGFWEGFLAKEKYHTGEDRRSVYWQTLLGGLDGFAEEAIGKRKDKGNVGFLAQFETCMDLKDCDSFEDRANSKEYKLAELLFYSWLRKGFYNRIWAWLRLDWPLLLQLLFGLRMLFRFLRLILFGLRTPGIDDTLSTAFPSGASRIAQRRVVRTDGGLIGLAAPLTIPGDTVALCEGGKLPLILRKSSRGWKFIGECYVHGIMDGGKWDELEKEREAKAGDMSSFWII